MLALLLALQSCRDMGVSQEEALRAGRRKGKGEQTKRKEAEWEVGGKGGREGKGVEEQRGGRERGSWNSNPESSHVWTGAPPSS